MSIIANLMPGPDMMIIILILVVLFGVKKLPEIGKSMAEGIHEFKKAARKAKEDEDSEPAKPEAVTKQE
jgi:sec-independent protein translocase protein TatA